MEYKSPQDIWRDELAELKRQVDVIAMQGRTLPIAPSAHDVRQAIGTLLLNVATLQHRVDEFFTQEAKEHPATQQ